MSNGIDFKAAWENMTPKDRFKIKIVVVACVLLLYSQPFTEAFLGW